MTKMKIEFSSIFCLYISRLSHQMDSGNTLVSNIFVINERHHNA